MLFGTGQVKMTGKAKWRRNIQTLKAFDILKYNLQYSTQFLYNYNYKIF